MMELSDIALPQAAARIIVPSSWLPTSPGRDQGSSDLICECATRRSVTGWQPVGGRWGNGSVALPACETVDAARARTPPGTGGSGEPTGRNRPRAGQDRTGLRVRAHLHNIPLRLVTQKRRS